MPPQKIKTNIHGIIVDKVPVDKVPGLRFIYMDSLRGFAAMIVVWSHFSLGFGLPDFLDSMKNTPVHILWDGFASVSMFFVLSGFVLSFKPLNHGQASESSKLDFKTTIAFYIKRVCRIYLPFVLVLMISLLCSRYLYDIYSTDPDRSSWLYGLWANNSINAGVAEIIKQGFLIIPGTLHSLVPQAWTLSLEMQFSLLMPFLIAGALHSMAGLSLLCLGCVLMDLSFAWLINPEISIFFACFFHFYLGILMSRFFKLFQRILFTTPVFMKFCLLITALAFYSFRFSIYPYASSFFPDQIIPYCTALGSFLLLLTCSAIPSLQQALSIPFFNYLGKISYSLYLCHIAVLIVVLPLLVKIMNHSHINGMSAYYFSFALATALCGIFAALSYWFIERPSIMIGRFCGNLIAQMPRDKVFPFFKKGHAEIRISNLS